MKDSEKVMVSLFAIGGALALIPAVLVFKAFILVSIWGWFLVPLGAPSIGIAVAIGVMSAASFLNGSSIKKSGDVALWQNMLAWLTTWLIAWVAHMFV